MKEDFKPLVTKLKPNQCYICGSEICIVESEVNYVTINDHCIPIDSENKAFKSTGICTKCGKKYGIFKTGMYSVPELDDILTDLEKAKKIKFAEEDLFKNPFGRY